MGAIQTVDFNKLAKNVRSFHVDIDEVHWNKKSTRLDMSIYEYDAVKGKLDIEVCKVRFIPEVVEGIYEGDTFVVDENTVKLLGKASCSSKSAMFNPFEEEESK